MRNLKVYLAGPYTKGDPVENTHKTIMMAERVEQLGHTPYIPHLTMLWHVVAPHDYSFWCIYDLAWLEVCDVLLRLPGESPGADREVAFADEHGIPVVCNLPDLVNLIKIWDDTEFYNKEVEFL